MSVLTGRGKPAGKPRCQEGERDNFAANRAFARCRSALTSQRQPTNQRPGSTEQPWTAHTFPPLSNRAVFVGTFDLRGQLAPLVVELQREADRWPWMPRRCYSDLNDPHERGAAGIALNNLDLCPGRDAFTCKRLCCFSIVCNPSHQESRQRVLIDAQWLARRGLQHFGHHDRWHRDD